MERPNGRRRDQLRALLTRSPQENISGADPRNHNNPLAPEQEENEQGERREIGAQRLLQIYRSDLQVW